MKEITANDKFMITKEEYAGGIAKVQTSIAQLVYEIQEPLYFHSDVRARFDEIAFTQEAPNREHLTGIIGLPRYRLRQIQRHILGTDFVWYGLPFIIGYVEWDCTRFSWSFCAWEEWRQVKWFSLGLFSKKADGWDWLRSLISIARLRELLHEEYQEKNIDRVEIPTLFAVHFLLKDHLDRGANPGSTWGSWEKCFWVYKIQIGGYMEGVLPSRYNLDRLFNQNIRIRWDMWHLLRLFFQSVRTLVCFASF